MQILPSTKLNKKSAPCRTFRHSFRTRYLNYSEVLTRFSARTINERLSFVKQTLIFLILGIKFLLHQLLRET